MKRKLQGQYVPVSTVGEQARAFVPAPLPPCPPIDWTPQLHSKFDQALLALGRLDSVTTLLPETALFLYMYVRKEALMSSQIEGTQTTLEDVLAMGRGTKNALSVFHYLEANPIIDIGKTAEATGLSFNTVAAAVKTYRYEYFNPDKRRIP